MIDDIMGMIIPGIGVGILIAVAMYVLSGCAPTCQKYVALGEPCPDTCKCEVYPK